jgi:hypothetical protein
VIPTANEYAESLGADRVFSGLMIGINPLLACCGAWITSWALTKTTVKTVVFLTAFGSVLGSVLYALAGLTRTKYTLLVARAAIGLFSGLAIPSTYIGSTVGINRRSEIFFYMSALNTIGCALGPAMAAGLEVFVKEERLENLVMDSDTVPGWFMALVMLLFMVMTFLLFEDSTRLSRPTVGKAEKQDALDIEEGVPVSQLPLPRRLPFGGLGSCFYATFLASAVTTSVEVYLISLGKEHWGWSIEGIALFLAGLMLTAGCINLQLGQVAQRLVSSDREGILIASVLSVVCCTPLFNFGLKNVAVEAVVVCVGMTALLTCTSVLRSFSFALVTKLVPAERRQSVSTYSTISMTVGRGVGAVVGAVLTIDSFAPVVMGGYGLTAMLCAAFYGQMLMEKST